MKYLNLTLLFCLFSVICTAQKPPIDHSVYDSWKSIKSLKAPGNSHILVYTISPQQGDSKLVFHNTKSGKDIFVERAVHSIMPGSATAAITPDGTRAIATIKPLFEQTRAAKIKKTKRDDMPKDTLAIVDLTTGNITKFPAAAGFKAPAILGNRIAFQKAPKKDSLFILDIISGNVTDTILNVASYNFSPDGSLLTYITKPKTEKKKKESADSTATSEETACKKEAQPALYAYNVATGESSEILSGPKGSKINLPTFYKNNVMAFSANTDTAKTAKNNLAIYMYNPATKSLVEAVNKDAQGMNAGWIISPNGNIAFSENGSRLFFGTAPKPLEKDTTVPDFEKPQLDIWSWHDDYIQPGQLLTLNEDLRQAYTAYINIDPATMQPAGKKIVQLGDIDVPEIDVTDGGNADFVLFENDKRFRLMSQWSYIHPTDIYVMNVKDGSRKLLYKDVYYELSASEDGQFYAIYDMQNKWWLLHNMATGELKNLTADLPGKFYDIEHDTPSLPRSAGPAMWVDDNSALIIKDYYDVWSIDPKGTREPICVTEGFGKENNISFTPMFNLVDKPTLTYGPSGYNRFARKVNAGTPLFLNAYNNVTKENGIYSKDLTKKKSKLVKHTDGPYTYRNFTYIKGEKGKAPVYAYLKGNFQNPMDLWITKDNFKTESQLTDINPQQRDYNWGTAELVSWYTLDSIKADGILYKPEDFDPNKKYPVIIYFYEKSSNTLHRYSQPAPSRSTVNIPYFVSNGYIVFVPDIYYFDGHPGQSAMRSIMSGVEMLEQFPWIDGENMAIQGQSWGGYQVAYMITQTNKFKAAGAGAPVANMTSAYGGVRWGSGITRQFQYEQTQSRIGKDLWSGYDLYVENSPLFFLPNVTTPVLIMHNDQDGAVPWYQGIELFAGLKRLGKVAWLLQYNNEEHNLEELRNAKDLSIRLEQFFNHYLKGAPMPKWMKYGRPAVEKEYDLGYELIEE